MNRIKSVDNHKYDDIIDLPHHVSAVHPQMPIIDRAAQFSPFAALTGYEAAISESARFTDAYIELDESKKELLNEKLQQLKYTLKEKKEISITYFLPDERKCGGAYVTVTGFVEKIDEYQHRLRMNDGTDIPIDRIYEIR